MAKRPGSPTPKGAGVLAHNNQWPAAYGPVKQEGKIDGEAVGGPMCVKNETGSAPDMAVTNTAD
jgi:hypothetical protein